MGEKGIYKLQDGTYGSTDLLKSQRRVVFFAEGLK